MNKTSIPNQVRIWLSQNPGFHKTGDIAAALGVPSKQVSSVLSKLVKADRVVRENGAYADPNLTEGEDLIGNVSKDRTFGFDEMKTKIAKLLSKAERTSNDKERDAFNAKAEHLMLKLGVQKAELEATGDVKPEKIVEVTRDFPGYYSIVMIPFTVNVAGGFGNLTVLQQNLHNTLTRRAYIIGHEMDVQQFTTLLDSLSVQVMHALHVWQKENIEERRDLTDMEKYIQHRSFISGFGREVGARLADERVQEEELASEGAALVLASKQSRINSWMEETYPKIGNAKGGARQWSSRSAAAGRKAGAKADLGNKRVDGKKELD